MKQKTVAVIILLAVSLYAICGMSTKRVDAGTPARPIPAPVEDIPIVHELDGVTATYYCTCEQCCGKSDGITASGRQAIPGVTIAVDPDIIPLGTLVTVSWDNGNVETYRADDVGGAISGKRVDILCESHEEALRRGVDTVTLTWTEEGDVVHVN